MGYFPNGTAGDIYRAQYCDQCVHVSGQDGESGCAVMFAHVLHNYSKNEDVRSVLEALIPRDKDGWNQRCEMFRPGVSPNGGEPVPELTETDRKYIAWQQEQRTTRTDVAEPANLPDRRKEVA